jgi:uncharacterized protein (DUF3820 family)
MANIHDSAFSATLTFGKYKGQTLGHIASNDPGYLKWMARTDGMPETWRTASSLVLEGESIEHLGLSGSHVELAVSKDKPTLTKVNDTTVAISFGYNHPLKDRFKDEVDGRKWDKDNKRWKFAAVKLPKVVELFGGTKNVIADEGVKELYREEMARRKALDEIRVKTDTKLYNVDNVVGRIVNWQDIATLDVIENIIT